MRTTLAIDDDVLEAAKAIARQKRRTIGEVISDLARRALLKPEASMRGNAGKVRNGVPLLDTKGGAAVVTLDIVNALRDETT